MRESLSKDILESFTRRWTRTIKKLFVRYFRIPSLIVCFNKVFFVIDIDKVTQAITTLHIKQLEERAQTFIIKRATYGDAKSFLLKILVYNK